MNKKKMILTSLASVAVLGAAFVASQPSVVKADDPNTATTPAQPAGETELLQLLNQKLQVQKLNKLKLTLKLKKLKLLKLKQK